MEALVRQPTESPDPNTIDQRVYLRDVDWEQYEAMLRSRGESAVPRLTYIDGVVEIMSPSIYHKSDKTRLARLIEAWCIESGIDLSGYGSWTLKKRKKQAGAEPDECYVVERDGGQKKDPKVPDFAIEVVWTHGGIDKLEVYQRLGVREVWYWRDGQLRFFALRGELYEEIPASEVLPELDVALIVPFMDRDRSQSQAVRELVQKMRG